MSQNSPLDQTFIQMITDLQNRVDALSTARQPYLGEWRELPESLTIGANQITIQNSTVDPRIYFRRGTRVKYIKNGTTQCYGYVGWIDGNNKVRIYTQNYGANNWTFTGSDTITSFQYTELNPKDFPSLFYFTATPQIIGVGQVITGTMTFDWSMNGDQLIVHTGDIDNLNFSGTAYNSFFVRTPFDIANTDSGTDFCQTDSSSGLKMGIAAVDALDSITNGNFQAIVYQYDFLNGVNNWVGTSDVYYSRLIFRQTTFPYNM